jgi:microcompartment protein CcmK/EutM
MDEGNGARQILKKEVAPVRAVIVGIVDDVEVTEQAP